MNRESFSPLLQLLTPALSLFVLLSALTGLAYPLLVTAIGRAFFPVQAAGSLLLHGSQPVGSQWIGQQFSAPDLFWSRPSATSPAPYTGTASGGSNWGPLSPALEQAVRERVQYLRAAHPHQMQPIPVDLVTSSASGLDPHLSPSAADYQVERVARARGLAVTTVRALVERYTEAPQLGFLGAPRVHVLRLNLALVERQKSTSDESSMSRHRQ